MATSDPPAKSESAGCRERDVPETDADADTPAAIDLARLGRRLATLRTERGLSQAGLAARAGIPRPYVNALEAGRHEPTLRTLTALAHALGYDASEVVWLLVGKDYANRGAPLGQRVHQRRLALGYQRQSEFADAAGVSRATLNQVERGRIANPKLTLLCRLADALRCCPSELVAGLDRRESAAGRDRTGGDSGPTSWLFSHYNNH